MNRKIPALLIAAILLLALPACGEASVELSGPAAAITSLPPKTSVQAPAQTSSAPPSATDSPTPTVEPTATPESTIRPYAEWVGVWESAEGVMVIRFSRMADFVLDCYYYYPDQGFGFQINISDDEVDGNNIHSRMIDPAFDYHAEYEFALDGDSFDFIYHYQQEIIEESTFTRTDETDIEGTWKHYWDL